LPFSRWDLPCPFDGTVTSLNLFVYEQLPLPSTQILSRSTWSPEPPSLPPFLNHKLLSHWIAAHSSSPPISTIKFISPLTACPIKGHYNQPHLIPTLEMATAKFAEMLVNTKHSTWLSPKSQSYTLNSSSENLQTRISLLSITYKILTNNLLSKLIPYADKLLGIISVDFDVIDQLLIRYCAFIRY
jgi:hypothetical protein